MPVLFRCGLASAFVWGGCLAKRKAASWGCWQPAIDCSPSTGCSSELMALLSRRLALSCDRHMRNASAAQVLSALICGCARAAALKSARVKGCVVGLLAASNRLQPVDWVQ